jgi:hypothetical protein
MAAAVLSGRVDTHGYGLPFGWHSGKVWGKSTEECARIPNVGAEQMPGFLAQVVQDRHGQAAWQLRLREEKAPLLQRTKAQGNSINILCQEAKDCAGAYCEQKQTSTRCEQTSVFCTTRLISYLDFSTVTPMLSCVLSMALLSAGPVIEIAPGVNMPYVNLGTGSGQHGNVKNATALWIAGGGVGIGACKSKYPTLSPSHSHDYFRHSIRLRKSSSDC